MEKFKFELFVKSGSANLNYKINNEPIIIGSSPTAHIFLDSEGPEIKVIIQRDDDCLSIKVYDLNYPIVLKNKLFKSAKIKKSVSFKIGKFDFVFKKELEDTLPELPGFDAPIEDILPDFEETDTDININKLKLPESPEVTLVPKTLPEIDHHNQVTEHNENSPKEKIKIIAESGVEFEDAGVEFNIKFNERELGLNEFLVYSNPLLDWSSYVGTEDDSVVKIPIPEIHVSRNSDSFHIIHTNNGTVLSEEYYSIKQDRLFLSNRKSNRNHFLAHDAPSSKEDFIHSKNGVSNVIVPEGFKAIKYVNQQMHEVGGRSVSLGEDEKVVMTCGTTQLIVSIGKSPSKIKTNPIVNLEEKLLKSIAMSWAFALFFITTVLIVDVKKQEPQKKEAVVIFKRKKVEDVSKTPTPPSTSVAKSEVDIEKPEVKSDLKEVRPPERAKKQTKVEKKVAQVAPAKKITPKKIKRKKVRTKIAANPIKTRKSPAKLKAQPVAKKKFDFGFGSKMKDLANTANTAKLKTASTGSGNIADSMSSKSKLNSNFNQESIGKTNSKISRFVSGIKTGTNGAIGTKGLSGKTDTTTSYLQANTKILGAMDPELIRKIMREYIPQFRHCYQRELVINPSVAGVFDLEFQINSKGKGVSVGVKKQGKNFSAKGMGCLKQVVSMIPFPKPKGGGLVDVKQPMNFYQQ